MAIVLRTARAIPSTSQRLALIGAHGLIRYSSQAAQAPRPSASSAVKRRAIRPIRNDIAHPLIGRPVSCRARSDSPIVCAIYMRETPSSAPAREQARPSIQMHVRPASSRPCAISTRRLSRRPRTRRDVPDRLESLDEQCALDVRLAQSRHDGGMNFPTMSPGVPAGAKSPCHETIS